MLWYSGVFGAVVHCRSKSGCVQPQRRSVVVCRAGGLPSELSGEKSNEPSFTGHRACIVHITMRTCRPVKKQEMIILQNFPYIEDILDAHT